MPLRVSEIARRISAPGEDVAALTARLRHWAKEGILIPKGEKHPGTGRSCLYSEDATQFAAIINEMMKVGIPAVVADKLIRDACGRRGHVKPTDTKIVLDVGVASKLTIDLNKLRS